MTPATFAWGRRILPLLALREGNERDERATRVMRRVGGRLPTTFGDVIEIGARNVNGSFRPLIEPYARSYVGTDLVAGPGVDLIIPVRDLVARFGHERFDLVICTETIEHIEHWHGAVWAMKAIVRVGGCVVITTRTPGFPRHDYPSDFWRFMPSTLGDAFVDFEVVDLAHNTEDRGVYIAAQRLYDSRPDMPTGAAFWIG